MWLDYNYLGILAANQGDYENARKFFEVALSQAQALGDIAGQIDVQMNLGRLARLQGDSEASLAHYEKAFALAHEARFPDDAAQALEGMAVTYAAMGDYGIALEILKQSLEIRQTLGDRVAIAVVLTKMAMLGTLLLKWDNVGEWASEALVIFQAVNYQDVHLGHLFMALGEASYHRDQFLKAKEYFEKAVEVFHRKSCVREEAEALTALAKTLGNLEMWDQGLKAAQRAAALWDKLEDSMSLSIAWRVAAACAFGLGLRNVGFQYFFASLALTLKFPEMVDLALADIITLAKAQRDPEVIVALGEALREFSELPPLLQMLCVVFSCERERALEAARELDKATGYRFQLEAWRKTLMHPQRGGEHEQDVVG